MKKLLLFLAVLFITASSFGQKVGAHVIKYKVISSTVRDTYTVPSGETWKIFNTTTGQFESNIEGAGWVADGVGTVTDLQDAYDGSTSPEITTDGTREGLSIQGGTGTDTDVNLETRNNAGTQTLSILANGYVQQFFSGSTYFGEDAGLTDDHTTNNNAGFGNGALEAITTGAQNTAVGGNSLNALIVGSKNTGIGYNAMPLATGSGNIGIGESSLAGLVSTGANIGIGNGSGEFITGGVTDNSGPSNSIYIGQDTKAAGASQTNQIVIGHEVTGNGSNTVTIGNGSITDNYFNGTIYSDTAPVIVSDIDEVTGADVVPNIIAATEAEIIADAPVATTVVICTDCPPADVETGTVLDMSGHKQTDDTAVDTATFTLTDIRTGGFHSVLINEATEPSITGATNIPNTQAFVANKKMVISIYVEADDTVWYTFTQLVL